MWKTLCSDQIQSNFNLGLTIFSCLFDLATKIDHRGEMNTTVANPRKDHLIRPVAFIRS